MWNLKFLDFRGWLGGGTVTKANLWRKMKVLQIEFLKNQKMRNVHVNLVNFFFRPDLSLIIRRKLQKTTFRPFFCITFANCVTKTCFESYQKMHHGQFSLLKKNLRPCYNMIIWPKSQKTLFAHIIVLANAYFIFKMDMFSGVKIMKKSVWSPWENHLTCIFRLEWVKWCIRRTRTLQTSVSLHFLGLCLCLGLGCMCFCNHPQLAQNCHDGKP